MPSTEYILCAVAQNATGIGYGPKLHVTTDEAVLPVLSEIVPLDSTVVSIEVSAQVLDAGKSALKEVGFCWSMESQEPTPSHNHQTLPLPADGEAFTLNIENLTADQTYYIRAYAYNDEEEPGYSPVKIFRTTSSAPIVENAVAEDIEYTTATLKARIASHGGLTITAKGFYYSDTNTNPGEGDMQVTATNAQADSIIASVDGLASHTHLLRPRLRHQCPGHERERRSLFLYHRRQPHRAYRGNGRSHQYRFHDGYLQRTHRSRRQYAHHSPRILLRH